MWPNRSAENLRLAAGWIFAIGFLKAVIIPMWPLIKWIKQTIIFLVTVCEVLVAIPLWVAFHLVPEGDGFSSERTKTGYGILLEAALRPMLLVMGMIMSFMIMWPALYFVSLAYNLTVLTVSSETGITSIFTMVGHGFVYAVITLYVVDWACDVIDGLNGRVMSWINVAPGHNNNDVEQKMQNAFVSMKSQITQIMGPQGGGGKTKSSKDGDKPLAASGAGGQLPER